MGSIDIFHLQFILILAKKTLSLSWRIIVKKLHVISLLALSLYSFYSYANQTSEYGKELEVFRQSHSFINTPLICTALLQQLNMFITRTCRELRINEPFVFVQNGNVSENSSERPRNNAAIVIEEILLLSYTKEEVETQLTEILRTLQTR